MFVKQWKINVTRKLTETDPRAEPLIKERVPYVVVYGNPNLPLIKLVRRPEEFLKNPAMRLNAHYYIEKVIIPALNRCLLLAGMNTTKWYKYFGLLGYEFLRPCMYTAAAVTGLCLIIFKVSANAS